MIKEAISKLESKGYVIKEIKVNVSFTDNNISTNSLSFFSGAIYREGTGFSNYPTNIKQKPKCNPSKISSSVGIEFYLSPDKLNDKRLIHEPKLLLEKVTNDVIDSLEMNCIRQAYAANIHYPTVLLYTSKNSINYGLWLMNLENNKSIRFALTINKEKIITKYL